MNILVTGATGRVGSRLVPRLLRQGHEVRVLARRPEAAASLQALGADIVPGDLLRPDSLTGAVAGIDAVVHLAAFFRGATPEETTAVNLEGTLALARAALQAGAPRFVFASTNLVYGPGAEGRVFRETDAPNPAAPYPATKTAAEAALAELHHREGLGLRTLRLAFVYGDGDPHLSEGLGWFRRWRPEQRIHLVHHADVAQAAALALSADGIDGQIYNVADGKPAAASEIMQLYGESFEEGAEGRAHDAAWHQIVDTAKLRGLGYVPRFAELQDAVRADAM
ncbi:NAD-dependent epimerase/dehydratase family protein [Cohnella nanjingensis]|uniref:NAD(P)-dependent oxidoreductase n=1 Tax=Cohnella nanjingensis TaxID=1387779 RepID=A0A7X0RXQ4_9BACL|nr:NAD(P)-dependent oxidoreductase [Cohnella nanjingensis]MBB6674014.1 NAD(P)-dependent oxidoreductase [Cohnella nanjingensis]